MSMRRIFLAATVLLGTLAMGYWGWRQSWGEPAKKGGGYRILPDIEGVVVDIGQVVSSQGHLILNIPLKDLHLKPTNIRKVETSCSCTVANPEPNDSDIRIELHLRPGRLAQRIVVLPVSPSDSNRIIRISGEVIPGWYSQPSQLHVDRLSPDQEHPISCEVALDSDSLPQAEVLTCKCEPNLPIASLQAQVTGRNRIRVTGSIKGTAESLQYKGELVVVIGVAHPEELRIPLSVSCPGLVQLSSGVVVLRAGQTAAKKVVLTRIDGNSLAAKEIECPDYLHAETVTEGTLQKEAIALLISLRDDTPVPAGVDMCDVKIRFEGIDHVVRVPVVLLHSRGVTNGEEDGLGKV